MPSTGNRSTLAGGLLIVFIGAVPVVMYYAQQQALRQLGQALSRGLGLPVSVENVRGSPFPAAVFEGVRLGVGASKIPHGKAGSRAIRGRPMMSARRVEIEVDFDHLVALLTGKRTSAPVINRVRLVRPTMHLTRAQLRRWLAGTAPSRTTPAAKKPRTAQRLPEIHVEGGSVILELPPVLGQRLVVRSRDIFMGPRGTSSRLLLGHTTLKLGEAASLDLAAVAVELDPFRGYRLKRLAAVGGTLRMRDAWADIHVFRLLPGAAGHTLFVQGELGGDPPGKVNLRARVDRALRLRDLRLSLEAADMGLLRSLLKPHGLLQAGGTRLSGLLTVGFDGLEHWIGIKLRARDLTLHHRLLATRSVGPMIARLEGQLSVGPGAGGRLVRIHALQLTSGAVKLNFDGSVTLGRQRSRVDLGLAMAGTSCQQILTSLPGGFAPTLRGMVFTGKLGVRGRLKLDSDDLDHTEVELKLEPLGCKVVHDPPAADANTLKNPVTINILTRTGGPARWVLGPANKDYRPLDQLSRHLRPAFEAAEDNLFSRHDGFDRKQLVKAFVTNLKRQRAVKGASTISQQLIKNVFLNHNRTISRKFQEAVLTWRMEQCISKRRIMELYLNMVEMGPGIYGVTRAADVYFGKPPQRLTPLDAAYLAMLTPSPRRYYYRHRDGKVDADWFKKVHWALRKMRYNGHLSLKQQQAWQATELRLKKRPAQTP